MKKKALAILLSLAMVFSLFPVSAFASDTTSDFSDMPSDWSTAALENAVNNGLLAGDNGKIMPNDNLTRAQMAAVVNRAFGTTEKVSLSSYTDVAANAWYYDDMAKAVQMKTFVGSGDGKLNPDANITREEAFAVLARAFKLSGASASALNKFSDKALVSSWAKDAAASLISAGYVAGYNGQLNPNQYITRAEFAQIMDNILKNYIKTAGTYATDYTGNMMINVPEVTLKNIKITGDLIIGDGVGNGDVTLDGVTVTGRTIIRGGGVNSIKIIGNTNLQNIIIARVDGQVRVYAEDGTQIGEVIVDGSDNVIIEGNFGTVTVAASDITLTATNADIVAATIDGDRSIITVSDKSTIKTATIEGDNAKVITLTGAKIGDVIANGEGATISGTGTIGTVEANGNNTAVTTPGTSVTAASGSVGNMAGTKPVTGGTTEIVGGGSSGSGNGNPSGVVSAINVTGDAVVGATLTAALTPEEATGTYQWKSSDSAGGTYADITGATSSTYVIDGAYAGEFIKVIFTASGSYTGSQTSVAKGEVLTALTIANPTLTATKVYNGTTTAAVTAGALSGIISGDTVTVTAVATYNTAAVETGKTITVVYTLGGTDAAKYVTPVNYSVTTGAITAVQLTIATPTLAATKVYNGTTTAAVTAGALSGIISGDTVTVTAVATYNTAAVETGKTITVVYTLGGTDATKYITPASFTMATGVISAVQLTIANPTLTDTKAYDGTTTAAVTAGALTGVVSGDNVTVTAVATYNTATTGTGKTITVVYTLGGTDATKYITPANYTTTTGAITAAAPVISGVVVTAGDYKVGSAITVTISSDGTGYTAGAITVNGIDVASTLASAGGNNYAVTYTVGEGNTDRSSVDAIPISIVLTNGGTSCAAYTTAPTSGGTVTIDAHTPTTFAVTQPTTLDNGTNGDGLNSVTVTWTDSVDAGAGAHYEIVAKTGSAPGVGDTVTGQTNIAIGAQTATFNYAVGADVYAGVVAVDANGNKRLATSVTPNVTVAADTASDVTAPILSATSASAITDTTATLNFTSGEAGIYYYLVYAAADTPPDVATIKQQGIAVAKGTAAAAAAANTASVTGMKASTAYKAYVIVVDAANNASAVSTIAVTTTAAPIVGQSYGGGIVAYIFVTGDNGYVSGQTHGLIAATGDQSTGIIWVLDAYKTTSVPAPGATGTAIGTGFANTNAIVTQNGGVANTYAAGLARNYTDGTYHDWYLPSEKELIKLYAIGSFTATAYWSSSETNADTAVGTFNSGTPSSYPKSTANRVRAVRTF